MKRLSLFLLTGLLGGCAVGPTYQTPEVTTPVTSQLFAAEDETAVTTLADWWTSFQDPLLTQYVREGLKASPTLEAALARLRASRAQREGKEGSYWPQITANGGYTWSRSWGARETSGWEKGLSAGADAAWELDLFGSVTHGVEQLVAAEAIQFYSMQDLRVSLAAEIATAYVNVRRYQTQLRIAEANLINQRRNADIARQRSKAGTATQYDYATALAQLARVEAALSQGRQRVVEAMLQLDYLTGKLPYATKSELESSQDTMIPAGVPKTLANDLLRRRADLRAAEANIRQQTAAVGSAKANLYPKFRLSGNIGLSSPDLTPWDDYTRSVGLGPSVSWNLFGFGTWRKQVISEEERLQATVAEYQDAVLNAYREAENTWALLAYEHERKPALSTALEQTFVAYEIALKLYKAGEEDVGDVLSQESNLLTAQENIAVHHYTLLSHAIMLYKVLGGGWADEQAAAEEPLLIQEEAHDSSL